MILHTSLTRTLLSCIGLGGIPLAAPAGTASPASNVERNIPYAEAGGPRTLDLHLPAEKSSAPRPLVMIIHGGGWAQGDKQNPRADAFAEWLTGRGYAAASINYTLTQYEGRAWKSPKIKGAWPDNLYDCKSALRFLRLRHREYGIDPERVALLGASAGGHLALLTGLSANHDELNRGGAHLDQPNSVRGIISFYGIPDVRRWGGGVFIDVPKTEAPDIWALASPVEHLSADSPPMLVIHGDQDPTVDIALSEEFVAILRDRKLEHEYVVVPGAGHGFALSHGTTDLRHVIARFLERCFQ